jgi:hypothetical protein
VSNTPLRGLAQLHALFNLAANRVDLPQLFGVLLGHINFLAAFAHRQTTWLATGFNGVQNGIGVNINDRYRASAFVGGVGAGLAPSGRRESKRR